MIIKKFISQTDRKIDTIAWVVDDYKLDKEYEVKEGYTYYVFITEERNWIRHSGKLTKEEKQLVIKLELENKI